MNRREQILEIKRRIKELAVAQKADKKRRKGCPREKQSDLWCEVFRRTQKITAHLNFYHMIREYTYEHGIGDRYLYVKEFNKLCEEFKIEVRMQD